jgi:hypothetical protein
MGIQKLNGRMVIEFMGELLHGCPCQVPLIRNKPADGVTAIVNVDTTNGTVSFSNGIKIGNDTTAAGESTVGTLRYRATTNNSYLEMVMQTGTSTYEWVVIKENTW